MKTKDYAHYIIVFGIVICLVALGNLGGGQFAWADNGILQDGTVPTMTPTSSPDSGNDSDDNKPNSTSQSHIIGTVIDLSTGLAGAGVTVKINGAEVTTDSFGDYSISELAAGEYTVSLFLEGSAISAQSPVIVYVDGINDVIVNLEFYSDPSGYTPPIVPDKAETPTSVAVDIDQGQSVLTNVVSTTMEQPPVQTGAIGEKMATAEGIAPEVLPKSGTVKYDWRVMFGAGLLLLCFGYMTGTKQKV